MVKKTGALGSQLSPTELRQLKVEIVQEDMLAVAGEGGGGGGSGGEGGGGGGRLHPGSYDLLHDKGTHSLFFFQNDSSFVFVIFFDFFVVNFFGRA